MIYVIDASVAVTSVVSRPLTSKALRLRQANLSTLSEASSPSSFRWRPCPEPSLRKCPWDLPPV